MSLLFVFNNQQSDLPLSRRHNHIDRTSRIAPCPFEEIDDTSEQARIGAFYRWG